MTLENQSVSESKLKTSKSCYQMFEKWKKTTNPELATIDSYVLACSQGYPNGTKLAPSLLKARVNGIKTYYEVNNISFNDKEFIKAITIINDLKR
jgi:hypothetical protein